MPSVCLAPPSLPKLCIHIYDTGACRHIHDNNRLDVDGEGNYDNIKRNKKKSKLSPRKRRGGTQVADGRSSQANAATSRWLCDRHSTGKTTRSHIRQSFDCKRNPAAREESRAVVWWGEAAICWSTGGVASQGIEGGGKGGKRMLVERRRCPRLSLPPKKHSYHRHA